MRGDRYRDALGETVIASAFPYGYTLTIWTSGAVLAHARGLPTTVDAFLFVGGALIAYVVVATIAFSGFHGRRLRRLDVFSLWEAFHLLSIGVTIGAAAVVAHLVHSLAAWPLDGFLATALYLTLSAFQVALVERFNREERG
jgi:hypothetical protein